MSCLIVYVAGVSTGVVIVGILAIRRRLCPSTFLYLHCHHIHPEKEMEAW